MIRPLSLLLGVTFVATLAGCSKPAPLPTPKATNHIETSETKQESVPMENNWPFEDVPNLAVITLTRITDGTNPILYVVHDKDGDWQFLDGGDVSEEDAETASLKRVVDLDSTIEALADLPMGWAAEREAVNRPWQRFER